MWSETQGCISFPHIHISIKIPHEGNKGFIMRYEYYCWRIALKLSSFSFSHSQRICILPLTNPLSSGLGFWLKSPILSSPQQRPHMSSQALQPSMIVLLIDWPSLSRLIHLSLYTNCPLTSLTRTNRWTKYGVPEPQREKNENRLDAPRPCHGKEKESAEIRSLLANAVKKDALPELLRGKGQSKCLQSVTRQKKKETCSILADKWAQQSTLTAI